ncbi:MAG: hypothetical protein HRT57_01305 [Crocinitomicaceae bacterium]|nr:hypothetical protein [Crocinitomicaceae bacterium]
MKNGFFIGLIALFVVGCNTGEVIECDGTVYSFSQHVQPLINQNCNTSGCHAAGSVQGDFTSFDGIQTKVTNGSLRSRILDRTMPINSDLTIDQKKIIICWIEDGAQDN